MNGFITKPFTAAQLIKGIAEALNIALRYDESIKSPVQYPVMPKMVLETDLTYLEKFCEGDRLRMKKYIVMFLEAVPGFRAQLLNALESVNYTQLATKIHGFKTKWVMMGMQESKTLADNIEKQCREGVNLHEVPSNVFKLLHQIELALSELQAN